MDVLDKVPQVPVDYANHVIYGGLGGIALALVPYALISGATVPKCALFGLCVMTLLAAVKKLYDYTHESETWKTCVAKALVTVVWPASLYAVTLLMER